MRTQTAVRERLSEAGSFKQLELSERGLTASHRRKAVHAGVFMQLDSFYRDSFIESSCVQVDSCCREAIRDRQRYTDGLL